ncbi:MAG: RecX family transcriptional regulator [Bacteroidales bacterium]|nr:RecX family transcriptional regulator [Bacteroidales bacterium]
MTKHHHSEIPAWALNKMKNYCAFQERCISDVRQKLSTFHLSDSLNEMIIQQLLKENFLNEERFAKVFAGGKFRINKWGKNKIFYALQSKGIPDLFIQEGLNEIDPDDYREVLVKLIVAKEGSLTESDLLKKKQKLATFAITKGFEQSLVWDVLNKSNLMKQKNDG